MLAAERRVEGGALPGRQVTVPRRQVGSKTREPRLRATCILEEFCQMTLFGSDRCTKIAFLDLVGRVDPVRGSHRAKTASAGSPLTGLKPHGVFSATRSSEPSGPREVDMSPGNVTWTVPASRVTDLLWLLC